MGTAIRGWSAMITRAGFMPAYGAEKPERENAVGYTREYERSGVNYVVAISRPVHAWLSKLAPGDLIRTGINPRLLMSKANIEMDPSDPTTWQREYLFT